MTCREIRFRKKAAEEVRLVLTGHVKCPKCRKYVKPVDIIAPHLLVADAMCRKCSDKKIETAIERLREGITSELISNIVNTDASRHTTGRAFDI